MKKKGYIIAVVLLLIAALVLVLVVSNTSKDNSVKAYDFREGFLIVPDADYEYGIATDSSFTITTKDDYTLEEMKNMFFIGEFDQFTIEKVKNNDFKVTLQEELQHDQVYVTGIKVNELVMASFVYQTTSKFAIVGYLPAEQSTNVPVNTGVEVYFSNGDIGDFDKAFTITPEVKGAFEEHDNAYVFVPKDYLSNQTVYTVTIKGGVITNSDGQVIEQETVFSFETAATNEKIDEYKYHGYMNFNKLMYEYKGNTEISIPYYMNMPDDNQKVNFSADIYQFDDGEHMVEYIKEVLNKPYWSMYNAEESAIDTSGLKNVQSFNNNITFTYESNYFLLDVPEQLEKGSYLVKLTWEYGESFVVLQVTDLSAYLIEDVDETFVWVHDLQTGEKARADVQNTVTDSDGMAIVKNEDIEDGVIKVSDDNNETYLFKSSNYYNEYQNYWNVLTTDRNLYKPTDTINFFGFVAPREGELEDQSVTVEINRGYFYFYYDMVRSFDYFIPPYPMNELPLISFETTLDNGFYEGNVNLPSLSEGYYTLTIKYQDQQVSTSYFNVEEYEKPTMKIEVVADKKAIFAGETVTFDVNTSFYEGTPVAGLDVTYYINYENDYFEKTIKSDLDGNVTFSYTPIYKAGTQGSRSINVGVRATLPETGELVANSSVRVYLNDINYTYETDIVDDMIKLKGNVYHFVPDYETGEMINTGAFINQTVSSKLYKHTLVKRESGTYYDYISKKTVKQYTYDTVKTLMQSMTLTTDANGDFKTSLPFNDTTRTWYTIELEVNDKNNRAVNRTAYVREQYDYGNYYYNQYRVELDQETYSINDTVHASFMYGDEVVEGDSYMYVISQNGIKKIIVSEQGELDFTFNEDYIPNANIRVIAFDGQSYVASYDQQVLFNKEDRKLNVEITTDKDEYAPGETAVVSIKVTDEDGNPVNAKVLLSAVDEALLTLSDVDINFLDSLYRSVGSGIRNTYATHKDGLHIFYSNFYEYGRGIDSEEMTLGADMMKSEAPMLAPEASNDAGNDGATIRSDFKDTATFITINTDEAGMGIGTFTMPDNITSWRIFSNAMNNDFYAGGNFINVNTTLPFFLNVVSSDLFLVNDQAYIGVTGYGDDLKKSDVITYKVYLKSNPENVVTKTGNAFERVNIELPSFMMGNDSIIVEGYTNNISDGLETKIIVTDSYNKMQQAYTYEVKNNMTINGGSYGNTTLVFADMEYITYVSKAFNLSYYGSERLELLLARDKATSILDSYLTDPDWFKLDEDDVDYKKYQQSDGGLAILPYAQSDIKITVDNLQFLRGEIDESLVLSYLYQQLNEFGSNTYVLYGLSQFDQPILLELTRSNSILNLTTEELTYLALAYYNIGDIYMANDIYENRIKPSIVEVDPYSFINEKNEDYSIYLTAKVAYLAKLLNQDEAASLFKYTTENYTKEYVVNNYIALYLEKELNGKKENENTFTYNYMGYEKEVTFENGKMFTYEIPSKNLNQFKVSNVKGDIGVIVKYEEKMDIQTVNLNSVIKVTRKYLDATTNQVKTSFDIGDIIKVEITVKKGKNFVDTIYEITDILPSGLKAIEKPYQYLGNAYEYTYMRASEQTAKATISKYFIENNGVVSYYARVINIGQYESMGTYVKLLKSNEVVYQDLNTTINIEE